MKERDPLTLLGKKWEQVSHAFSFFFRQKADRPAPKHMRQLTTWQILLSSGEGDFTAGSWTVNLFLEIWVSLHHHPVVSGHLGPKFHNLDYLKSEPSH